jgi:hypothetical protein
MLATTRRSNTANCTQIDHRLEVQLVRLTVAAHAQADAGVAAQVQVPALGALAAEAAALLQDRCCRQACPTGHFGM